MSLNNWPECVSSVWEVDQGTVDTSETSEQTCHQLYILKKEQELDSMLEGNRFNILINRDSSGLAPVMTIWVKLAHNQVIINIPMSWDIDFIVQHWERVAAVLNSFDDREKEYAWKYYVDIQIPSNIVEEYLWWATNWIFITGPDYNPDEIKEIWKAFNEIETALLQQP
jgi:hypothetical protein